MFEGRRFRGGLEPASDCADHGHHDASNAEDELVGGHEIEVKEHLDQVHEVADDCSGDCSQAGEEDEIGHGVLSVAPAVDCHPERDEGENDGGEESGEDVTGPEWPPHGYDHEASQHMGEVEPHGEPDHGCAYSGSTDAGRP